MENDYTPYGFLSSDLARKHFADADIVLKQGRHIQDYGSDHKLFVFLDEYYDRGLKDYYLELFKIRLVRDSSDRNVFYYLDFLEDSRGKLGKDNRYRELDAEKILFAILLLNSYKEKFFEDKQLKWNDLEMIFKESEHKQYWLTLLYGKHKKNYTPNEEDGVKNKVIRTLQAFQRLGWVHIIDRDSVHFEILPAIERISRLYADVIANVDVLDTTFELF